ASEVVQIAMLDGTDVLYLARHEGRAPYSLGTPIGSRLPAALSATGNAILATIDEPQVAALLAGVEVRAVAEPDPRRLDDLLARVSEVRRRGYAVDRAESFAGVIGVAVPLTPWSPSDPLLAIGAALPAEGTDEQRVHEVAATRRVRAATQAVRDNRGREVQSSSGTSGTRSSTTCRAASASASVMVFRATSSASAAAV